MEITLPHITAAIAVGLGATLILDLWGLSLKRIFNIPSPNYCLVGRWIRHMPGTFRHRSIAAAPRLPLECAVGWTVHYAIGACFALTLVLLAPSWLEQPTPVPALLMGVATVIFPFFVMQPSFGLGIASSKAPNPAQARLRSLLTHTVFGIGLYLSALALNFLLKALA